MKILLVENDALEIARFKETIKGFKFGDTIGVTQCGDWFEVKREFSRNKVFDLIFLRVALPIFDGVVICKMLTDIYEVPAHKIFLMKKSTDLLSVSKVDRPIWNLPLKTSALKKSIVPILKSEMKMKKKLKYQRQRRIKNQMGLI